RGEGQHVGGPVAAAEARVEAPALARADHAHAELAPGGTPPERGARPAPQLGARRRPGAHAPLQRQLQARVTPARGAHPPPPRDSYACTMRCTSGWRTTSWASKKVKATPSTSRSSSMTWLRPERRPAGRSVWVTSPVTTAREPKPMRVRNIFICSTVVF